MTATPQLQAGIEDAYAFAAVADDDNANILAARMAREIYHVKESGGTNFRPPSR
ncbi:hypothetical protein [Mobiluncus curtisii]|uniref:hypothetical protein n=1 Tax=Mobiluncus curtisii TaxID=2051 RepID=UPI0020937B81|nr:hypothetical protein [Mobiluncus curtisii]